MRRAMEGWEQGRKMESLPVASKLKPSEHLSLSRLPSSAHCSCGGPGCARAIISTVILGIRGDRSLLSEEDRLNRRSLLPLIFPRCIPLTRTRDEARCRVCVSVWSQATVITIRWEENNSGVVLWHGPSVRGRQTQRPSAGDLSGLLRPFSELFQKQSLSLYTKNKDKQNSVL